MAYLDTSILGSYYCAETLSPAVNRALMSLSHAVISPLVEVEFLSLLSIKVRTGDLDRPAADHTRRLFHKHRANQLYHMAAIGTPEYAAARRWLGRFDTPLRTLDALHLAVASANRQQIWTTDKPLAAVARALAIPCKLISL